MHYLDHNEFDLATDDFFIRWVKSPDAETKAFWQAWLEAHPYKRHQVEQARKLLLSLEAKEVGWDQENEDHLKARIMQAVHEQPSRRQPPLMLKRNPMRRYWQTAAFCAAIAMLTVAIWFSLADRVTYQTSYGVVQEVVLPDSSTVVLSANSSLAYRQTWWTGDREVHLEGEAFFTVRRTPKLDRFTVVTDGLETEVLGTAFNVKARRSETTVVLQSGKVQVSVPEGAEPSLANPTVHLAPGQLARYALGQGRLDHQLEVDLEAHIAWRQGVLVFDKTPLWEVAERLDDFYGLRLVLPSHVASQTFSARVPVREGSEQVLLELIGESFLLDLIRKDETIYAREQANR